MPAYPEWTAIGLLGGLHGVNPAMGWLFAVSLGLQAQSGRAVWAALGPLALGHALAVAVALAATALLGVVLPLAYVRWIAAVALLVFGVRHVRSHAHSRWSVSGMCVGPGRLTMWSFLVSSAHGAGLMVLPFVLRGGSGTGRMHAHAPAAAGGHAAHLAGAAMSAGQTTALVATLLHTVTYFAVSGAIAYVVYEYFGLRFLRRAWVNMNVIWAIALIATAVVTPLL
jgi:hypothetical protein